MLDHIKVIVHTHFTPSRHPCWSGWSRLSEATAPGVLQTIVDNVVCYTQAWDGVLAEWDAGQLDVLFPPCHMVPWSAMAKLSTWSKEQGETK